MWVLFFSAPATNFHRQFFTIDSGAVLSDDIFLFFFPPTRALQRLWIFNTLYRTVLLVMSSPGSFVRRNDDGYVEIQREVMVGKGGVIFTISV